MNRMRRAAHVPGKLKNGWGTPHTILFIVTQKGREFSG